MPKIDVVDVKEGMVIAADVFNLNGQLLMPKGITIAEKHVWLLKSWGVQQLEVEKTGQDDANVSTQITEEEAKLFEGQLREIFGEIKEDELWAKHLFDLCLERKVLKAKGMYGAAS